MMRSDIGEGSFGVVKYARHIVKGKTRSEWPEYAVKVRFALYLPL